jgi:hypothetical protein
VPFGAYFLPPVALQASGNAFDLLLPAFGARRMTCDVQKIIKLLPLLPSLSALSTCCKVSVVHVV